MVRQNMFLVTYILSITKKKDFLNCYMLTRTFFIPSLFILVMNFNTVDYQMEWKTNKKMYNFFCWYRRKASKGGENRQKEHLFAMRLEIGKFLLSDCENILEAFLLLFSFSCFLIIACFVPLECPSGMKIVFFWGEIESK